MAGPSFAVVQEVLGQANHPRQVLLAQTLYNHGFIVQTSLTMLAAPVPFNEGERLAYVRGANCAYSPREERFDRVTRTAKRLLHVPIALISQA